VHDRLKEIIEHKRTEVEKLLPLAEKLRYAASERNDFRSFRQSLIDSKDTLAVISEVKKASPSAGVIAEDFDPLIVAQDYAAAGADAISVLTDEKFFQGHLSFLSQIRQCVDLPLLRKDFIIHETQVWEAVIAGADAILLIVAALEQDELVHLLDIAGRCQLDVLVEVHDLAEMERALDTETNLIGINNRNLKSFEVSLESTEQLSQEVGPDLVLVSESGILNGEDARRVHGWGADAILVGEALMRASDKTAKMAELKGSGATDAAGAADQSPAPSD
jgi:indole-3-glycerol phosphate synthase